MIEVSLKGGGVALLDGEDERLARIKWCNRAYAVRFTYLLPGREGKQSTIRLHREVVGLAYGDPRECDHINRNRLDNRRANLRVVEHAENCQNVPAQSCRSASAYRGVSWHRGAQKWCASVGLRRRQAYLGLFTVEIDAARASEAFRRNHLSFAVPDGSLEPVGACVCRECR